MHWRKSGMNSTETGGCLDSADYAHTRRERYQTISDYSSDQLRHIARYEQTQQRKFKRHPNGTSNFNRRNLGYESVSE